MDESYEILREQHHRLRRIAKDLIQNARPGNAPENAVVDADLLVRARRELAGEPQPSAFATMSVS